ncbi:MAG: SH3 domain-containing protein [Caldilineaceae bacterium]
MSTIKLATAYQLVLTSLLVGACLGILGRQLPNVFADTLLSVQAMDVIEPVAFAQPPSPNAEANTRSELALTTSDQPDANVQIEVEVHTTDGASAVARAMGPNDTEVKTDTNGEGHGRAVARLDGTLSLVGSASSQLNGATNATIQPQVNSMQSNAPIAVVQADLANLRSAPSISSPIVGHSMRNQQFKIVGRDLSNSWWLVCCYNNQMVWISGDVVNAQGATAAVEVIYSELNVVGSASANSLPSNTVDNSNSSQSAGTNDQVVAAPPTYEYELVEQRQHGEQVTPRIFLCP